MAGGEEGQGQKESGIMSPVTRDLFSAHCPSPPYCRYTIKNLRNECKNIDSVVKQTVQFHEQTLPNPTKAGKYKLKRIRTTAAF